MPWLAMYSLTWRMLKVPKWKTLAARTASASPSMMPSAKCHGTREREVEALLGTVAVHAGEQDLAGAATRRLARPVDGVDAGGDAAAGKVDLPPVGTGGAGLAHALGVDRHDDGLAAERVGRGRDDRRVADRRRVERDLVGAGRDHGAAPRDVAEAAAHRIRDAQALGGVAGQLDRGATVVGGRRDVQEDDLVRALAVVALGKLHRVAGVAQAHEVDALDHATVFDVQAGDHSFGQHGEKSFRVRNAEPDGVPYACQAATSSACSSVKLPS